jgi:hypothetical protein
MLLPFVIRSRVLDLIAPRRPGLTVPLRGLSSFPASTPPLRQEQYNRNTKEQIIPKDFKM